MLCAIQFWLYELHECMNLSDNFNFPLVWINYFYVKNFLSAPGNRTCASGVPVWRPTSPSHARLSAPTGGDFHGVKSIPRLCTPQRAVKWDDKPRYLALYREKWPEFPMEKIPKGWLVSYLVLWAQSTTKVYTRAEHKLHSISKLFNSQVIIPQVMLFEPIYIPRELNTGTCIRQGDLFYSAGLHRNFC